MTSDERAQLIEDIRRSAAMREHIIEQASADKEFDIAAFCEGKQWTAYLFPRIKHRPDVFHTGELTVSPASVDLCGVFVVPLADLLFNLFGDKINRCVEVSFGIFGEQVRPRHGQPHGAGKLFFGGLSVVVLQRHARIDGETVKVVKLVDAGYDVILDGFRERHIVRRENQFHEGMM